MDVDLQEIFLGGGFGWLSDSNPAAGAEGAPPPAAAAMSEWSIDTGRRCGRAGRCVPSAPGGI
jgi:hypothetical protein